MALLLNQTYPYFEIYVPEEGTFRKFKGGRLEISEDDDAYGLVMAEAAANPYITVLDEQVDEQQVKHTRTAKAKAGVVCDACRPAQTFDSDADLQAHLKLIHMALPAMDAEGNEIGRRDREDAAPTDISIPAAKRKS